MPAVFVLSLFDTGLVTARLLAKAGRQVYGFDANPDLPGFRTRLFPVFRTPALSDEKKFVDFLCAKAKECSEKPLLIPGSDAFTEIVLNNYSQFSESFHFSLSSPEIAKKLLSKQSQYELLASLGVNQAKSISVFCASPDVSLLDGMKYPLLIKPLQAYPWKRVYTEKAMEVSHRDEAEKLLIEMAGNNIDVIVQEIIPGDVTNNIETGVYVTRSGAVSPVFCYRKLRQYPAKYGVATFAESEWLPEIQSMVTSLVKEIGLRGFANIEFKYHPQEKKYYLIEINTRVWQQIDFAASCGLDYTDYFYKDMAGENIDFPASYLYPARWISPYSDVLSFIESVRNNKASIGSYFSSYNNAFSFSLFDKRDIMPALYDIEYGLKFVKAPFKLLGKLFR